jgi:hypothetical protein
MATATVEVLTAEVRALMVGSRQVTLSVFRQLDWAWWCEMIPMGRVNDERSADSSTKLAIGRHVETGALVRAGMKDHRDVALTSEERDSYDAWRLDVNKSWQEWRDAGSRTFIQRRDPGPSPLESHWAAFERDYKALPLIVLAGLK